MPDEVQLRPRQGSTTAIEGMDQQGLAEAQRAGAFTELGLTGLRRSAGFLDEEFLPQLRGKKGVEVFKEMAANDPTVSAMLFTIERLVRNIDWRVEPAGKTAEDNKAAKLLETCMEDMNVSWNDFITEALSCLTYGWAWHEVVYKRRQGLWTGDSRRRSKFSDDLVGWRKLPIRSQDTLLRWVFDEAGETRGMVQMAPPTYKMVTIPIERSLLFRYRPYKSSPEGISMLRGAYRPWFFKKRIEEFESIGIERDLAGLPIVKVPAEMLKAPKGSDMAKSVDAFKKLVKSVRRNDQEGVVFPQAFDQETKQPLYAFELLGGGGARAFNTSAIIERYDLAILTTVLEDFIKVGHQNTGSYSMHVDKTGIFRTSLNAIAGSIADVFNRYAIPRLFLANGWKPAGLPKLVPSDVDAPDVTVLASFMSSLQNMGVQWFPDGELENFMRKAARLPELDEDELEIRRRLQLRAEATAFAQANADYLATQQSVSQMAMGGMGAQPGQPGAAQPGNAVQVGGRVQTPQPGAGKPQAPGAPGPRKALQERR